MEKVTQCLTHSNVFLLRDKPEVTLYTKVQALKDNCVNYCKIKRVQARVKQILMASKTAI